MFPRHLGTVAYLYLLAISDDCSSFPRTLQVVKERLSAQTTLDEEGIYGKNSGVFHVTMGGMGIPGTKED